MTMDTRLSKGRDIFFNMKNLPAASLIARSDIGTGFPAPLVVPVVWRMKAVSSISFCAYCTGPLPKHISSVSIQIGLYNCFRDAYLSSWAAVMAGLTDLPPRCTCRRIT